MAELKVEVFTSSTCPHCPAAVRATKELFEKHPELHEKVKWVELNTSTPEGSKKAKTYGIQTVPTIILKTKDGQFGGLQGTPTQKKYLEAIHEMLGETPTEINTPKSSENDTSQDSEDITPNKSRGTGEILIGGVLGALAVGEMALGLAVCPLCVIGAPIFIGVGAYKKYKKS